jgi:hypothetical protein
MLEPHTRETIKLGGRAHAILTRIRDRPFDVLTGITIVLVLLGTVIQQMIITPLTTPTPAPVVSASATLPVPDPTPAGSDRAVIAYSQPRYLSADGTPTRLGAIEPGRACDLIGHAGDWRQYQIAGSGTVWLEPGQILAGCTMAAQLINHATPIVQVQVIQIVVTATPRPPAAPPAPAPVVPVVPVAMPSTTPPPPVIPPTGVPEFATATAAPTYPILIRGKPRYMRDIVTPSPTPVLDVLDVLAGGE